MKLSQLATWLGKNCEHDAEFYGVKIDSRQVEPGDLFVAFVGEKVDGHDFAHSAIDKGAVAILAQKPIANLSVPILLVDDCFTALTECAKQYRQQLKAKILALTGSNGKTSVKEMLAEILPQPRFASKGNYNNQLGVPINILNVPLDAAFAIFELGANHIGDIAYTSAMVKPDIALINNIGPAHLGGFGSIEGVAIAKGEIYQSLSSDGIAVVNDDDDYAHFWDDALRNEKVIRYSATHEADVWAEQLQTDDNACYSFELHHGHQYQRVNLNVPGRHQVLNALAAASMAFAAGVNVQHIVAGLERFSGVSGRLKIYKGHHDSTIIDDTYNANLASIKVGLEYLAKRPGVRIFVMGDLAELGDYSENQHRQIGHIAKGLGIEHLFAVGQSTPVTVQSFGDGAIHFDSREHLIDCLGPQLNHQVTVLVKGSRSAKMEEVVKQLSNLY